MQKLKDSVLVKYSSPEEAVSSIESGSRVFLHGSAATPVSLVNALLNRYRELKNVELVSITNLGDIDFDRPELSGRASSLIHYLYLQIQEG